MVRYLFYTIGDLTYQSPLVHARVAMHNLSLSLSLSLTHTHTHTQFTRWHSWLRYCATSRNIAGSIPVGVIGIFHYIILPAAVTSAYNRNEYQEYLLGSKGG